MVDRIKIVGEEVLSRDWGILKRTSFEFQRRDGTWQRQVRETYDRGPAAAVLPYCPETGKIILVRQFRFPLFVKGKQAWILEACAGFLDGDDPETCARREAEEESGYRLKSLRKAFDAEMSPGSIIETVSCFIGTYGPDSKISNGGGLHHEGEDIEVVELELADALCRIDAGEITDAKTILLLQYLALHPVRS
ncbi:MAG TPA: NUDIX domain-containing protein [Devosiaceae bacterium]|nr:NUDIX domain-containing protein [Devosiaceae bacterium]